ncbi:MAG: hypothetical protein ACYTE0_07850, partial [Planctomycetota bacterium]
LGLATTTTAAGLDPTSTYYWRIDEGIVASPDPSDPNDVIRGQTWSFTTDGLVITSDPNDTLVPDGGTAVLEVVARSVATSGISQMMPPITHQPMLLSEAATP